MNRSYWEKIAPEYNSEIFDVLFNDKQSIIQKEIQLIAGKSNTVLDIGCAIGKWLPLLSSSFKKVIALDISKENLQIAKTIHSELSNISYERIDMSAVNPKIKVSEAAICINALLTDSEKKRTQFLTNLSKCVKKNGKVIMVVPSLESSLLTSIIRQKWNPDKDAHKSIIKKKSSLQVKNMLQGNIAIDSVFTKHFVKEELEILLGQHGFKVTKFEKIEYNWNTEFSKPPFWLKFPKPWDWMLVATKCA